ncbi:hypothetical protein Hanom_Chr01g00031581 [Helianthus anomalus]
MRLFLICYRMFPMDTPNASNSDCELVFENEVVSKAKEKKTQRKKQDGEHYVFIIYHFSVFFNMVSILICFFLYYIIGMKELSLEQPTIIIDEMVDESYETSETA